jgi:hypothetical protein
MFLTIRPTQVVYVYLYKDVLVSSCIYIWSIYNIIIFICFNYYFFQAHI